MPAFLKMLVYAPAGRGKTFLIGTAVGDDRLMPALLLDFEGGTSSIRSKTRDVALADLGKTPPSTDKIDVVRIKEWNDFDVAYEFLDKHPGVYKMVAVDTLTEVNYLSLRTCVDYGIKVARTHDPEVPEQMDYQRNAIKIRELVRFFRDLDMHVVFAAQSAEYNGQVFPSLTGKLPGEVVALLETVGFLAIEDRPTDGSSPKRLFMVETSPRYLVKDRSEGGRLGQGVVEPTLPKICDLLFD